MADTEIKITDVHPIVSYKWLDHNRPAILIPGGPRDWVQQTPPPVLAPDEGYNIIDMNANMYQSYGSPMESLFEAVLYQRASYDFSSLQIVTDRKPLSLLLKHARGDTTLFNFQAQVIGNLVVFTREKGPTYDVIGPTEFRGHRIQYERKYLHWPLPARDSIAHYRIFEYKLGDIKILLRYAADACKGLINALDRPRDKYQGLPNRLNIVNDGRQVHQKDVYGLTTRSLNKSFDEVYKEKLPELWLSQTRKFVLARSTPTGSEHRAVFEPEDTNWRETDTNRDVEKWEDENQDVIQNLMRTLKHDLLPRFQASTVDPDGGLYKVVYDPSKAPYVEIESNRKEGSKLPEEIVRLILRQQERAQR